MLQLNNIYHLDCMEGMKAFPDKYFELAIVDPPYGVGNFCQEPRAAKKYNRPWAIDWNDFSPSKEYFNELKRISQKYIIWGENYYKEHLFDKGTIIWDKGNYSGVGSGAELACTNIFDKVVLYQEKWTGFINSENIKGASKIHPCQKPIALYRWLLKNYANPGDKILDTHGGSFSSVIACLEMGFEYIAFEIDEEYYKNGIKRIEAYLSQPKIFTPKQLNGEQLNIY